jgi:4-amino-4-deoxy-L-arabinose transferase-like glycosyltransferase
MPVPPEADFATFYQMASAIADGHWWPTSYGWLFQGPLYPTLLAPFAPLGEGGLVPMRLVGIALQTLMIAMTWLLGRRTFGPRAAVVAAVVIALVPSVWLYSPILAAEHLTIALLTGAMALLAGRRAGRRPLIAGLLAGALVFARPAFVLLPVLVLAYLIWKRPVRDRWSAVRSCVLGIALAAAPIGLLNTANGGPPLPLGNAGWQQWLIFNERATGQWFPVIDQADYPFAGLGSGQLTDERVRSAQLKLALQYVVANPGELPVSFARRLAMTWTSDRHALEWTIGHTPEERASRFGIVPDLAVDGAYTLLIALAFAGAVAYRREFGRLLPILLPIAYILGIHLIAEGNARYHLPAIPFLAVLAAAALTRPRAALKPLLVAAIVIAQPIVPAPSILVVALIAVPGLTLVVARLRQAGRAGLMAGARRRPLLLAGGAAILVGGLGVSVVTARDLLDQIAAVAPEGWQAYEVAGSDVRDARHRVVPTDVPAHLHQVSFPDAFELSDAPGAGGVVGAARTLEGLDPEARYTFYLQLWDPAQGDRLVVSLNGRIAWQLAPGDSDAPGWRYVSVDWLADAPTVAVVVERHGESGSTQAAPLLIRDLHLYPAY